jgi:hypothetical protein
MAKVVNKKIKIQWTKNDEKIFQNDIKKLEEEIDNHKPNNQIGHIPFNIVKGIYDHGAKTTLCDIINLLLKFESEDFKYEMKNPKIMAAFIYYKYQNEMEGNIMGKSKGSGDKKYPMCAGPECWCYDCSIDSVLDDDDDNDNITDELEKRAQAYAEKVYINYIQHRPER